MTDELNLTEKQRKSFFDGADKTIIWGGRSSSKSHIRMLRLLYYKVKELYGEKMAGEALTRIDQDD